MQVFTFVHKDELFKMTIKISNAIIYVTLSAAFIKNSFTHKTIIEATNQGIGRKLLRHPNICRLDFYDIEIKKPKEAKKALYEHQALIFCTA